jgi:hypothetical protein
MTEPTGTAADTLMWTRKHGPSTFPDRMPTLYAWFPGTSHIAAAVEPDPLDPDAVWVDFTDQGDRPLARTDVRFWYASEAQAIRDLNRLYSAASDQAGTP